METIAPVPVSQAVISHFEKKHYFLGDAHGESSTRTWNVIYLCTASMVIEIICGVAFGSMALVSDGVHMGTHVCAFLIAALSYSYASKHADNPMFVFGTGKVGELAAFASAIILAIVGLVILYESLERLIFPDRVEYLKAIPVGFVGLAVNIFSGLILMGVFDSAADKAARGHGEDDGGMCHGHSHGHQVEHYDYDEHDDDHAEGHGHDHSHNHDHVHVHGHDHGHGGYAELSPSHRRQHDNVISPFHTSASAGAARDVELGEEWDHVHEHEHAPEDSSADVNNPLHGSNARTVTGGSASPKPTQGGKSSAALDRMMAIANGTNKTNAKKHDIDNNYRAAVIHVVADAAVSILVILALLIEYVDQKIHFLDPLVGVIGAIVIISWGYTLAYDTAGNLLDLNPDAKMCDHLKSTVEADGSTVTDLHVWRLGPGHLGCILSIIPPKEVLTNPDFVVAAAAAKCTHDHDHSHHHDHGHDHDHDLSAAATPRSVETPKSPTAGAQTPSKYTVGYYMQRLKRYRALSHITIELLAGFDPDAPSTTVTEHLHGHDHGHDHSHGHGHGHGGHGGGGGCGHRH